MGSCAGKGDGGDGGDEDEEEMLGRDMTKEGCVTILLHIAAIDLPPGRLDTFVVVYAAREWGGIRDGTPLAYSDIVGRTDTCCGTACPTYSQPVRIEYRFEEVQPVVLRLYHERSKVGLLTQQEYVGECESDLSTLIGESPFECDLVDSRQRGQPPVGRLRVIVEELKSERPIEELVVDYAAAKVEAKNTPFGIGAVGTSDPFLVMSRVIDREFVPVAKTEPILNVTPQGVATWAPLRVRVDRLCGDDRRALILVEVLDWESSGKHQSIGSFWTDVDTLVSKGITKFDLVNNIKRVNPHYIRSGVVRVPSIRLETCHTFLDFLRGGQEINLTVAIDFSKSNLPFDNPKSLHFLKADNNNNEYMTAIEAVAGVLSLYDKDQQFPLFGFGARLPEGCGDAQADLSARGAASGPTGFVSHCFNVTLTEEEEVHRLDGIAEAYWDCVNKITPMEPTCMAPAIRKVSAMAQEGQDLLSERRTDQQSGKPFKREEFINRYGKQGGGALWDLAVPVVTDEAPAYQLMLILTDGAISDMGQTIDAIVESSGLPMSILIVGVGLAEEFSKMQKLAAGDEPLRHSNGTRMQRDIVGFVPFRRYSSKPEELAKECLKDIPSQFMMWASLNCLKPKEAQSVQEAAAGQLQRHKTHVHMRQHTTLGHERVLSGGSSQFARPRSESVTRGINNQSMFMMTDNPNKLPDEELAILAEQRKQDRQRTRSRLGSIIDTVRGTSRNAHEQKSLLGSNELRPQRQHSATNVPTARTVEQGQQSDILGDRGLSATQAQPMQTQQQSPLHEPLLASHPTQLVSPPMRGMASLGPSAANPRHHLHGSTDGRMQTADDDDDLLGVPSPQYKPPQEEEDG